MINSKKWSSHESLRGNFGCYNEGPIKILDECYATIGAIKSSSQFKDILMRIFLQLFEGLFLAYSWQTTFRDQKPAMLSLDIKHGSPHILPFWKTQIK